MGLEFDIHFTKDRIQIRQVGVELSGAELILYRLLPILAIILVGIFLVLGFILTPSDLNNREQFVIIGVFSVVTSPILYIFLIRIVSANTKNINTFKSAISIFYVIPAILSVDLIFDIVISDQMFLYLTANFTAAFLFSNYQIIHSKKKMHLNTEIQQKNHQVIYKSNRPLLGYNYNKNKTISYETVRFGYSLGISPGGLFQSDGFLIIPRENIGKLKVWNSNISLILLLQSRTDPESEHQLIVLQNVRPDKILEIGEKLEREYDLSYYKGLD